jgi:hypothetical protein
LWTSCHVHHILLVHTHFCCTPRMRTYMGSSLVFSWKCAKWHFRPKLNFILYARSMGELTLYVWVQNAYWISFVSFNQCLSSITKKGEIECASRSLVNFGVLNDNLIKGLISCVKCISRFLVKVQMYPLIHLLKYNYEANRTMLSTCLVNK